MHQTRLNYFQTIHKSLRRLLGLLSIAAGQLDARELTAIIALKEQFMHVRTSLTLHAQSEDRFLQPLIQQHLPEDAGMLDVQHKSYEQHLDKIAIDFDNLIATIAVEERVQQSYLLYLEINDFMADYFSHLQYEECIVMPDLWRLCSDEELAVPLRALIESISPEAMQRSMADLLPAISSLEQEQLLANRF